MSGQIGTPSPSPVQTGNTAPEGPKSLPLTLPFTSSLQTITLNLYQLLAAGSMTSVQSAFVDNSDNTESLTITCQGTGQRSVIPPLTQSWIMLLVPNQAVLSFYSTGSVTVNVQLCNFAMTPNSVSSGSSFPLDPTTGYVETTDVALDALTTTFGLKTQNRVQISGDAVVPQFAGSKLYAQTFTGGGTGSIITDNPNWYITSLFISVDANASCSSAQSANIQILDGSSLIFETGIFLPAAAPTLIVPTPAVVLANLSGFTYISKGGGNLNFTFTPTFATGQGYVCVSGGVTSITQ